MLEHLTRTRMISNSFRVLPRTDTKEKTMTKIRLADGSVTEASIAPWTTTGDTVTKWLVVLPGIGSTFLTNDELAERLVDED